MFPMGYLHPPLVALFCLCGFAVKEPFFKIIEFQISGAAGCKYRVLPDKRSSNVKLLLISFYTQKVILTFQVRNKSRTRELFETENSL